MNVTTAAAATRAASGGVGPMVQGLRTGAGIYAGMSAGYVVLKAMEGDAKGAVQSGVGVVGGGLALSGLLVAGTKRPQLALTLGILGLLTMVGGTAWSLMDPRQAAKGVQK